MTSTQIRAAAMVKAVTTEVLIILPKVIFADAIAKLNKKWPLIKLFILMRANTNKYLNNLIILVYMLLDIAFFITATIVLAVSGYGSVKYLTKLAMFLKTSTFVLGFIVMGIITSLPELFVSINAGLIKNSALALGTIMGANIADLTLIGGITVLLARFIRVREKILQKNTARMLYVALLFLILGFLGNGFSRIDGAILILAFIVYAIYMFKESRRYKKGVEDHITRFSSVLYTVLFLASVAALFISSTYVAKYGTIISIELNLPPIFIGLFFIALGTTLPELVFSIEAIRQKQPEMAIGDLIGSVVANSTIIIGTAALISPIYANFLLFLTSAAFMLVCVFLFFSFMVSSKHLDWREGLALLLFYVLFLIVELSLSGKIGMQSAVLIH